MGVNTVRLAVELQGCGVSAPEGVGHASHTLAGAALGWGGQPTGTGQEEETREREKEQCRHWERLEGTESLSRLLAAAAS